MTDYVIPPPPLASLPVSAWDATTQRTPAKWVRIPIAASTTASAGLMKKKGGARATAGVGPMQPGDDVAGGVQGITEFDFKIGARPT